MAAPQTLTSRLPEQFAELEPFLHWDLATEGERYAKRLASSMPEMEAFYEAAFPRLREALDFIDRYDLAALPDPARTVMHLMQSLITVSFPVEVWKQPRVPDSGAASLTCLQEPVI
ncbi:hypothetical protein [Mycobacterium sp. 48b]|uniref:hypothetical protein n=1 Tax=Mycobacterium sp. 48b TaxID=3400426 RepID=UPI003AAD50FF